jgi:GT2 family glycosyltransferase
MKIYAIVVTYNGKKWIDKCFASLQQSEVPLEIIAVDNNSSDGIQEILKENYPDVKLIQSDKNLGFGAANNIGIAKAYDDGADYVLLLNQDAWIEPDTVKKLTAAQKRNSDYGVISPVQLTGSGKKMEYGFSVCLSPGQCSGFLSDLYMNGIQEKLYEAKTFPAACWLISRECLSRVGGFNPVFFHYGEDNNYTDRVLYHGFKVGVLPTAVMYHDIEERGDTTLNSGERNQFKLKLMKFSNPLENADIDDYMKNLSGNVLRAALKLSFNRARDNYEKYKAIYNVRDQIKENLEKSKLCGPAFLNVGTLSTSAVMEESNQSSVTY